MLQVAALLYCTPLLFICISCSLTCNPAFAFIVLFFIALFSNFVFQSYYNIGYMFFYAVPISLVNFVIHPEYQ